MPGQKEIWEHLGREILESSRNELLVSMRFFELAFPMLPPCMDQNNFFLATDGFQLFYNARFLAERYRQDPVKVNRAYLHVLLHGIFQHIFDVPEAGEDEPGSRELWDLSCDIAVEYVIDRLDEPCVRRVVPEECDQLYRKLANALPVITAEGVYRWMQDTMPSVSDRIKLSARFLADDHRYWEERKKSQGSEDSENTGKEGEPEKDGENGTRKEKEPKPEPGGNDPGREPEQKDKGSGDNFGTDKPGGVSDPGSGKEKGKKSWAGLSEKLQNGMETYFAAEERPAARELLRILKKQNRKKTDYRSFLRKFVSLQEELRVDTDSFDYAFYSYGLSMYGNMPLIEELEYRESFYIQDFVIVLDTSGSCSGQLIRDFVRKTLDILMTEDSFGKKTRILLLQCDDEVREEVLLQSREEAEAYLTEFEVKGYGGTDFRKAFRRVEELRENGDLKTLKGLLYFTDGYGIFPKKQTDYQTAFVFTDTVDDGVKTPPWAIKAVVS